MKKSLKIISTLLVIVMMVACMSVNVFAVNVDTVIDNMVNANTNVDTTKVTNIGKSITEILSTIGIVIAVIVLMVIGIKYMMGSAEEKAEYKKVMIPYIVGMVVLLSASAIVRMIAGFQL